MNTLFVTPSNLPASVLENTKSNAENDKTKEIKASIPTIPKSSSSENTEIRATHDIAHMEESVVVSTQTSKKDVELQQPEEGMNVEMPAIKDDKASEEMIDISTIYPFLKGYVKKVDGNVQKINKHKDHLVITKVEPCENLQEGVETNISVEVEYNLITQDKAILGITFNDSSTNSRAMMERIMIEVCKGTGKYVFIIPITPIRWSDGTPFYLNAQLHQLNDPDPVKNNVTIFNSPFIKLGIK